ncbi:MAG: hypothetical protein R3F31_16600 [Verrucomicrobiales bacterium]
MRRYIIAAALIGLVSSGLILVLSGLGLFAQPSRWLAHVFGAAGIFPSDGGVVVAWFVPILTIVVAFGVAWCAVDIPEVGQKLLVFLTTLVVVSGVALSAALFGIMVEPFSALSGATLAAGAGLFYASTEPGRRKRVLQTVLGNRISRSSFHRLLNRRDPIDFKGVSRDATVLTFRILSCSEAQDSMSPSDTVAMTNLYLRNIADFLLERGAYLDESSPDCVRVFLACWKKTNGMLNTPAAPHWNWGCACATSILNVRTGISADCITAWPFVPVGSRWGFMALRGTFSSVRSGGKLTIAAGCPVPT